MTFNEWCQVNDVSELIKSLYAIWLDDHSIDFPVEDCDDLYKQFMRSTSAYHASMEFMEANFGVEGFLDEI